MILTFGDMAESSLAGIGHAAEDALGHDDASDSAIRLQAELHRLGIASDVHVGYGLALLSVWVGLVVWCHGGRYWWRSGWDARRRRVIYAWHPAIEPARAAHRVARCHEQARSSHPHSALIAEAQPETA